MRAAASLVNPTILDENGDPKPFGTVIAGLKVGGRCQGMLVAWSCDLLNLNAIISLVCCCLLLLMWHVLLPCHRSRMCQQP